MKARWGFGIAALLLVISGFLLLKWSQDEPRRDSLAALRNLRAALSSNNSESLLNAIVLPQALRGRTVPEQVEFLRKALHDEISDEGVAALKRRGKFGPLNQVFPEEGGVWAKQAGAKPEDCIAFKMERAGIRAEVVLAHEGQTYRVVRCNNVKQMAGGA